MPTVSGNLPARTLRDPAGFSKNLLAARRELCAGLPLDPSAGTRIAPSVRPAGNQGYGQFQSRLTRVRSLRFSNWELMLNAWVPGQGSPSCPAG